MLEWYTGWHPNYYLRRKSKPGEEQKKSKKPQLSDLEALFTELRWLSQDELDDYYVSKALGRMAENNSTIFKYTGGWGDWPPEAVKALLVLGRLEMEVDNYYRELAELENSKEDKPAPPPPPLHGLGLPGQVQKQQEIGMTNPEVAKRKAASVQRFYAGPKPLTIPAAPTTTIPPKE